MLLCLSSKMLLITTLYQFTDCVGDYLRCCKNEDKDENCKKGSKTEHCKKPLCTNLGIQIFKKSNFV